MNAIETFFKEHYKIILIGLFGVFLGVFLNWLSGVVSNKNFLKKLITELNTLQEKEKNSELTNDEKRQIEYLKSEIYLLTVKCKI